MPLPRCLSIEGANGFIGDMPQLVPGFVPFVAFTFIVEGFFGKVFLSDIVAASDPVFKVYCARLQIEVFKIPPSKAAWWEKV